MKNITLLLICCFLPILLFAQVTTTIYASGTTGSYITGSAEYTPSATYTRSDGAITVSNSLSAQYAGYAVFNLSSLPTGAVVTQVILGVNRQGFTGAPGVFDNCVTYGIATNLSTVTNAATLYGDCTGTGGTQLWNATTSIADGSYGSYVGDTIMTSTTAPSVSPAACTFIQNEAGNIISVSFAVAAGPTSYVYNFAGETSGLVTSGIHAPYLQVTYIPPCTGVPSPGTINTTASIACTTSTITLTDTGYSSGFTGLSYQWQSSPDSLTWNNITGATSSAYTFFGLSATTYYRYVAACSFSGLSASTVGIKITYYSTCCSSTPTAGSTTASTMYCSACNLTLNLSGFIPFGNFSYQWQSSPDSITWTNMAGAATVPYTFTPSGAYYYRCLVTCTTSGLSSYSTAVNVLYQYLIVADTISNSPDTLCNPPQFYVKINGISPLLRLKTYYGDGSTDSVALINSGTTSYANPAHIYTFPGYYTLKQVLYYNNIAEDSIKLNYRYLYCRILPVKFYDNLNANCVFGTGDVYNFVPIHIEVDSNSIATDTLSATSGIYYEAHGGPGTIYGFKLLPDSNMSSSCPTTGVLYDTIQAYVNNYPVKYFGLNCTYSAFDLAVNDVIPVTGDHQWGHIYARNNSCISTNAIVTLYYSEKYYSVSTFGAPIDVSPTPTSYTDSTITWNLIGLSANNPAPVDLFYVLNSGGSVGDSLAHPGDIIRSYVTITPVIGDIDTINNKDICIDTFTAAFDPNEMSVIPAGCLASGVSANQLQYTVNFMNVGNDTAFNIYAMDTLSANEDPKSLQIVMASTTMNTAIFNDGTNNIVKFEFPGINLLDSTACPQCSGAVIFNINTLPGLPDGTTILNHAGVFFDYNPVVMTNTVENIVGNCATSVPIIASNNKVEIYPNPTTSELTIKTDAGAYNSYTITNTIGQVLIQQPLNNAITTVNVQMLPPGMYYVTVKGDNGSQFGGAHDDSPIVTRKFVKM